MTTMMNRIQALTLGLGVASVFSMSPVFAEGQSGSFQQVGNEQSAHQWGGKKGHDGQWMKKLGLSPEQEARMKTAREKFRQDNSAALDSIKTKHQQLKQLKKDPSTEAQRTQLRSELRQEMAALKSKKEATFSGILTPEQTAKMKAMKQEAKARYHQHHTDSDAAQKPVQ